MNSPELSRKGQNIEVVKFLKTPSVKKYISKLNNKYEARIKKREDKYEGEDSNYTANEATLSKKAMFIEKLSFYKEVVAFLESEKECIGRDIIMTHFNNQVSAIRSQIYNRVQDEFGMSLDVAVFTQDDVEHFTTLHMKDLHLLIVGWLNPSDDDGEISMSEKYEIYDTPEQYFSDED